LELDMGLSQTEGAGALRIGVIGAGTMGRGIVQLFAQAGHAVVCFDEKPEAAVQGLAAVFATFESLASRGRLTSDALASIRSRATSRASLADLAACDVVIEAVVEDIAVKRDLFARLEDVVAEGSILATNTSSLIVAEIASACRRPERVAGLHFFNPVLPGTRQLSSSTSPDSWSIMQAAASTLRDCGSWRSGSPLHPRSMTCCEMHWAFAWVHSNCLISRD
jgi:NAD(P)-dependent dehydrogenase (short-subunit alcohol dehydrogenase family)